MEALASLFEDDDDPFFAAVLFFVAVLVAEVAVVVGTGVVALSCDTAEVVAAVGGVSFS